MSRTPKAVQLKALEASRGKPGFAFYMEQGLGKTATAYLDFLEHVAAGMVSRMVVFCPNSFKSGWRDEAEEWGFGVTTMIYTPDSERHLRTLLRRGFDRPPVLIVNFEAARTEKAQNLIADFCEGKQVMGVVDESVAIAEHTSLQTKAILRMGQDHFSMTRVLSGKPIKAGPHDLWSQMRFLKQLNGMPFYAFRNAFCRMGGFKNKQVVGAINEDILAERINPVVFRATKEEWATDLPPKIYHRREYTMSREMWDMYQSMENEFVLYLSESESVTVDAAITKYTKLAQIQCGFIIDEDGKVRELVPVGRNPRLAAIEDLLANEVVGKATIVYRHKAAFDMLMERFAKYHPVYIKGGMSVEETDEQKMVFNESTTSRVMLLQAEAAKYGHTLLGRPEREHHCSTQIFFENSYSLDTRSQIEDRSHRYGQLGEVMNYYDLYGTPLDKSVVRALQRKENMFRAIFQHVGKPPPSWAADLPDAPELAAPSAAGNE